MDGEGMPRGGSDGVVEGVAPLFLGSFVGNVRQRRAAQKRIPRELVRIFRNGECFECRTTVKGVFADVRFCPPPCGR